MARIEDMDELDEFLESEEWDINGIINLIQKQVNQERNKKQDDMVSEVSKNMEKTIQEQEQKARREKEERDRREKEKEKDKDKIFEEASKNIKKAIHEQEKEIKQEKKSRNKKTTEERVKQGKKPESNKNTSGKKRKIYKKGIIKINRTEYPRLTEPKKRNILQRLILQKKYNSGSYEYIEEDYIKGEINEDDVYISGSGKRKKQNEYYKIIQKYEDALDDISIRKGWRNFKIGLGTAALIAITVTSAHTVSNAKDEMSKILNTIFMEENVNNENDEEVYEKKKENAENILEEIKESTGFEMTEFTLDEQIEAVIKIREAEKKLTLSRVKYYFYSSKDQELLDEIVESIYEENAEDNEEEGEKVENAYDNLSDQQKYELRKLAYELLTDEEIKEYFRDPQAVKEADDKQQQKLVEEEESEK